MEKPGAPDEGKAQEHHVPGHVGDEDVPEHQVAERIDQAGDHRQAHQQGRQRTVATARSGEQGLPDVGEEGRSLGDGARRIVAGSRLLQPAPQTDEGATRPAKPMIPHMT